MSMGNKVLPRAERHGLTLVFRFFGTFPTVVTHFYARLGGRAISDARPLEPLALFFAPLAEMRL